MVFYKKQRTIPMPSAAKYARLISAPKAAVQAATLLRLKRDVKRLKGAVETKFSNASTTITPTTTPQALATGIQPWKIVQGVTDLTRLGDKVVLTKIRMELFLTASVGQVVHLALVQNKQCGGVVTVVGEVYGDTTGVLSTQEAFHLGMRNDDYLTKYSILSSKHVVFDLGTGFNKRIMIEWKGRMEVKYDATAGAITDLTSNNFSLCYGSLGSTTTVTGPVTGSVEYEDM